MVISIEHDEGIELSPVCFGHTLTYSTRELTICVERGRCSRSIQVLHHLLMIWLKIISKNVWHKISQNLWVFIPHLKIFLIIKKISKYAILSAILITPNSVLQHNSFKLCKNCLLKVRLKWLSFVFQLTFHFNHLRLPSLGS